MAISELWVNPVSEEWDVKTREGEAPAEPKRALARRPPEASSGPPADADLVVGLGSAGASPSRKMTSDDQVMGLGSEGAGLHPSEMLHPFLPDCLIFYSP